MAKVPVGVWVPLSDSIKVVNTSGLYIIRNIDSGKEYVGKSIAVSNRLKRHMTMPECGSYLYKAIEKHGVEAFECCCYLEGSKGDLAELEKLLIEERGSFVPSGYNLTRGGEGMLGYVMTKATRDKLSKANKGRVHSEATIRLMSESSMGFKHTEASKAKIGAASRGHKMDLGHLEKLRKINLGRKLSAEHVQKFRDKVVSDAHRKAISEALKGNTYARTTPVLVWFPESLTPTVFETATAAGIHFGVASATIARWCRVGYIARRNLAITEA